MKKIVAITLLSLSSVGITFSQTTNVQKLEKSSKNVSSIAPIAVQYAKNGSQPFCEKAFVKEYIISNEVPADLPKMIAFEEAVEFRAALKNWIIANPELIKPIKRIDIK